MQTHRPKASNRAQKVFFVYILLRFIYGLDGLYCTYSYGPLMVQKAFLLHTYTLRLKMAQKPYIIWSLGPKTFEYESLEPSSYGDLMPLQDLPWPSPALVVWLILVCSSLAILKRGRGVTRLLLRNLN